MVDSAQLLGLSEESKVDSAQRKIVRTSDLIFTAGPQKGELAGYSIVEKIEITGVPLEQAYTIDAYQDEQLHEIEQTALFTKDNEAHRANGPIEMPAEVFLKAVSLAEQIPFDKDSDFAKVVAGLPDGLERHPAMLTLCDWWVSARPQGEPFTPGSAMPMVRAQNDGQYWFGHHDIPNAPVERFNPSGRDIARIGDQMLILFQATQRSAVFGPDDFGMTIMLPSGEAYNEIGIDKSRWLNGDWDEAWYCLSALASFRKRFPAAWQYLNKTGLEYEAVERTKVARPVAPPDGMLACPQCQQLPSITEDPSGKSGIRYSLMCCGPQAFIIGDSLVEVAALWQRMLDE